MTLKFFITTLLFCVIQLVNAQFVNQFLPFKQSSFTATKNAGFKNCMKYKVVEQNTKILIAKATYHINGMVKNVLENENSDEISDESETFSSATEYFFKENGQLNYKEIKFDGSETIQVVYEYKNNTLIRVKTVSIDPTIALYKYNTKGKLVEIYTTVRMPLYDEKGDFHGKTVDVPYSKKIVKCNTKGQIIQIEEYNLRNEETKKQISFAYFWKYDTKGRVVEYVFKNLMNDGKGFRETYEYNKQGLLINSILFDDSEMENKTIKYVYEYQK
jgi:hypothetical protein